MDGHHFMGRLFSWKWPCTLRLFFGTSGWEDAHIINYRAQFFSTTSEGLPIHLLALPLDYSLMVRSELFLRKHGQKISSIAFDALCTLHWFLYIFTSGNFICFLFSHPYVSWHDLKASAHYGHDDPLPTSGNTAATAAFGLDISPSRTFFAPA